MICFCKYKYLWAMVSIKVAKISQVLSREHCNKNSTNAIFLTTPEITFVYPKKLTFNIVYHPNPGCPSESHGL